MINALLDVYSYSSFIMLCFFRVFFSHFFPVYYVVFFPRGSNIWLRRSQILFEGSPVTAVQKLIYILTFRTATFTFRLLQVKFGFGPGSVLRFRVRT